jgi:Cu(I)/Ag(I) efflux system membrane fusion protein
MKMISIFALAFVLAFGVGLAGCWRQEHEEAAAGKPAGKILYQCPMHPQIVRARPGLCPICNMVLVTAESPGEEVVRHPGVEGRVPIQISQQRQQIIGLTFAEAKVVELERVIRASGRVAYDPTLYAAIEEYRQTLQMAQSFPPGSSGEARSLTESILRSTRMKLRLMGLSEIYIEALARKSDEDLAGLVLGRLGGSVWVYADVYEYEINLVKPGQEMVITSPALPGESFKAKVLSVDPVLNAATRTARTRGEVQNPLGRLKPEMYLQVKIRVPLGRRLSIPQGAVLDTGESQIAFVAHEDGTLEPRALHLGAEAEGRLEILSGLVKGERVVASANFLIDSESQIRSALEAFKGAGHRH